MIRDISYRVREGDALVKAKKSYKERRNRNPLDLFLTRVDQTLRYESYRIVS
jgi:hypothetical protein